MPPTHKAHLVRTSLSRGGGIRWHDLLCGLSPEQRKICRDSRRMADSILVKLEQVKWWRRRESNPRHPSEDNSTDGDTSRTKVTQSRYTKSSCSDTTRKPEPKDATDPTHSLDTLDTSLCAAGVPDRNRATRSLPKSIPPTVLARLRDWDHLPKSIRLAVEALLNAAGDPDTEDDEP